MARQAARHSLCAHLLIEGAAPLGAPSAAFLSASGPRFLTEQSALTLSASSSREVVVPPGGVRRRPGVGGVRSSPARGRHIRLHHRDAS